MSNIEVQRSAIRETQALLKMWRRAKILQWLVLGVTTSGLIILYLFGTDPSERLSVLGYFLAFIWVNFLWIWVITRLKRSLVMLMLVDILAEATLVSVIAAAIAMFGGNLDILGILFFLAFGAFITVKILIFLFMMNLWSKARRMTMKNVSTDNTDEKK